MPSGTPLHVAFYLVALLLTGGAGSLLLGRLLRPGFAGRSDEPALDAAFGLGLPLGLVLALFPGWLLSPAFSVPVDAVVLPLGTAALLAAFVFSFREVPRFVAAAGRLVLPFALGAGVFLFFLWLRWPVSEVRQTEKPLDLAILSAALETRAIPLGDPWMAGERLSYYHFGTLLLALPARVAGLSPGVAYNLLAALLPALAALAAFAAVRLKGGSRGLASAAGVGVVLAGTLDGVRQLAVGTSLPAIDFWVSSRRVAGAITEWPLFTFRLGDLHPHAISIPLLLSLAALSATVTGRKGRILEGALLAALVTTNPWDLPAGLLVLAASHLAVSPIRRAAGEVTLALSAALYLLVPMLLAPRPDFLGLRLAGTGTASWEAFLHLGGFLAVPALAVGVALVRAREAADEKLFFGVVFPAAGVALSIVTLKPVLGLALAFGAAVESLRPRLSGALANGFLLAAAGALLLALPEAIVVVDPYGENLRRMNTVFKTWSAAVPLLCVGSGLLLPLVLATRRARHSIRALLVLALAGVAVHPAAALTARLPLRGGALDGLSWMAAGDRAAAAWLVSRSPSDAVLAEAPGEQYGEEGRVGAASGRAVVLGWAGHERLWRGARGGGLVEGRRADLEVIFRSKDERKVREALSRRDVSFVLVGPVERKAFGPEAFPLRRRFEAVVDVEGTALYRVSLSPPAQRTASPSPRPPSP